MSRFRLFQGIRPFQRGEITKNLLAGFTLAAMNIPQSLGYATIAGMPVITGLYTLLFPLIAFAVFGASRYLVVAADSATAAILAGSLAGMAQIGSPRYVALAGSVALLTGLFLLIARMFKLGFLADFLSQTVLVGFLTGVGFQVGIAVMGEMFGIAVHSRRTPVQFYEVMRSLPQAHGFTVAISFAVVACILLFRRFAPKLPGPLFAVAGAVAASAMFHWSHHGVAVLGPVPGGLPHFTLPDLNWKDAQTLVPVAGACFVMIVAQSAATARAYAARHHQLLDSNTDLVGLSTANFAAAFSGTFVVNGSPTQTAMVESSGGTSQLAHLTTAGFVAVVLVFFTRPLQFLPLSVLGAVVFTIALSLIDLRALRDIRRESPGEFWLAVMTAAVVVLVGVEQGIILAMIVSLLRIVHHSYNPHTGVLEESRDGIWQLDPVIPGAITEPGIILYRFGAPLFYANANRFAVQARMLAASAPPPLRWFIVDAGAITNVDFTAARVVRELQKDLAAQGVGLAFARVQSDLRPDFDRHHLTEAIGPSRIFDSLHGALAAFRHKTPSS
ncbi:MAG TPA: SulP family inorganic anion transporter [Candidatus Acidoferrales bacterium]|nr:SulP family inorganic anion transporter [Candidatus Acidoferrales bacterium]